MSMTLMKGLSSNKDIIHVHVQSDIDWIYLGANPINVQCAPGSWSPDKPYFSLNFISLKPTNVCTLGLLKEYKRNTGGITLSVGPASE